MHKNTRLTPHHRQAIWLAYTQGKESVTSLARHYQFSRVTIYRALKAARVWGRYYFDTFIDKAKKGEIFKENKILNKNSGKIGFDTFRLKLVESNWTLIPFLHDFDEVLG